MQKSTGGMPVGLAKPEAGTTLCATRPSGYLSVGAGTSRALAPPPREPLLVYHQDQDLGIPPHNRAVP